VPAARAHVSMVQINRRSSVSSGISSLVFNGHAYVGPLHRPVHVRNLRLRALDKDGHLRVVEGARPSLKG